MNQVMEALLNRRSIRAFEEKPIPREEIEQIVEAGRYAPSGMGRQTWKFTVVVNREKIQKFPKKDGDNLPKNRENIGKEFQPPHLI